MPSEQLQLIEIAPHVRNECSYRAAEKVTPHRSKDRSLILGWLMEKGPSTDEEIQIGLRMDPNTERPRRGELVKKKLVMKTQETRLTLKGNKATLWKVVEHPPSG